MIKVTFQHWKYTFPEEELTRYGSPYFDQKTAGRELSDSIRRAATRMHSHTTAFEPGQILCANEAFPEAAVADPLADLDVWHDWRSGSRAFPYPGRYSQLGIRRQAGKTSSSSSVGVLGEIMAGIYAQAGIAPWVLVRVIRHWPDFISAIPNGRYAFVEAKAYTDELGRQGKLWPQQLPDALLSECLVNAVRQLNADPYVQVWGAFTAIEKIYPLELRVTFLELDVGPNRRMRTQSVLPQPVISGLAERALRRVLPKIPETDLTLLQQRHQARTKEAQRQLERNSLPLAMEELEEILLDEGVRVAVLASKQEIEREIRHLLSTATIDDSEGQRFSRAREQGAQGGLSHFRSIGAQSLLVGDLDRELRSAITHDWKPNWEAANKPWGHIDAVSLWRCGGVVFAIGNQSLKGTRIR